MTFFKLNIACPLLLMREYKYARLYQASESCGLISIAFSYSFIASSDLFNLSRSSPLLYQANESCWLISIALSYVFVASS